jgi:enoyl-CoA hydratase/carnithine racemase
MDLETMGNGSSPQFVRFEERGGVGLIVLHRAPQNRVNRQVFIELGTAVGQAARSGVRAVLLRSDGPDFCWGGEFREWPSLTSHNARRERFGFSNGVLAALENLPVPTITAVQGRAFGGGFELALHTDLIVAARSARFRFPEGTVAVPPLAGGAQRVAERAGRAVATRLVMLSEEIDAAEAARLGLVARVVPDDALLDEAMAMAVALADGPTRAHSATKAVLAAWAAGGVQGADTQMIELISGVLATDDVATGVAAATAALEKGVLRPVVRFAGR